jgi:hypothetical protein
VTDAKGEAVRLYEAVGFGPLEGVREGLLPIEPATYAFSDACRASEPTAQRPEGEPLRALGQVSVTLGPLVLRTQTAVLAALAVLRHEEGLLGE